MASSKDKLGQSTASEDGKSSSCAGHVGVEQHYLRLCLVSLKLSLVSFVILPSMSIALSPSLKVISSSLVRSVKLDSCIAT